MPGPIAQLQDLLADLGAVDEDAVACPDGSRHTIRAYREEAQALRELVRTKM